MNPLIGQSLIGGAGQIGSSIINAVSANKMQQKQFQQQQALYDKQFQQQRQMIAEQNAYNSPANQRKLLEEAGLNPMLMYQNGTSNSIQSDVARPEVAQAPLPIGAGSAIATGIDKSLQTMMSLAQIRQLEANTKKTESETTGVDITNSRLGEQLDATISNLRQNVDESRSRVNLNSQQFHLMSEQITSEQVKQEQMRAEIEGIRVSAAEARTRIINNMLEASLVSLRSALMQSQIDLNQSTISMQQAETLLKNWEVSFRNAYGMTSSTSNPQMALAFLTGHLRIVENMAEGARSVLNRFSTKIGQLGQFDLKGFLNSSVNNVGNIINRADSVIRTRNRNFKDRISYYKDWYF